MMFFSYLSKKIALPEQKKIYCIAWNVEEGFLACGGDEGLLKVVNIEDEGISLNRTLTGHQGKVVHVAWNPRFSRLASADENGLIIVWRYENDSWCEEMVNNRNQSHVTDLKWTKRGKHIGIIYQDGNIVVGSVEGKRIWGQEVNVPLKKIAWCPENRTIIFVTAQNEAKIYDHQGYYIDDLKKVLKDDERTGKVEITDIDWYDGESLGHNNNRRCLAIVYSNGHIQLMKNVNDLDPICVDTSMDTIISCAWNPSGEYIALCGYGVPPSGERVNVSKRNVVKFFDSTGKQVFSLKLPGKGRISGQTWEGNGMRLAIVIEGCIHLVCVKSEDKWAFDRKRMIFVPKTKHTQKVVIKDSDNETTHIKSLNGNVIAIHMVGDKIGIVTKGSTIKDEESDEKKEVSEAMLCDESGHCWKSKQIYVKANYTAMSKSYFVIAGSRYVYLWRIETQHHDSNNPFADTFGGIERIFDVCDASEHPAKVISKYPLKKEKVSNSITAICLSDELLCVSRFDGGIDLYMLPLIHHVKKRISPSFTIVSMQFNCDTTKMCLIDSSNVFRMAIIEYQYDNNIKQCHDINVKLFGSEKKGVWMAKWSKDEASACAIMEKANILTLHSGTQDYLEHPIGSCSKGYIAEYAGMEVTLLTIDQNNSLFESKTRNVIKQVRIQSKQLIDAQRCIEDLREESFTRFSNPTDHPKLWELLARYSLENMEFKSAQKAFVMLKDYKSISFVDRASLLYEKAEKSAEVNSFLGNYEEAEKIFLTIRRPELAIKMRFRMGDYDGVLRLMHESTNEDLRHEWNEVGDYFRFSKQHEKATECYLKGNSDKVIQNLYQSRDAKAMERSREIINASSCPLHQCIIKKCMLLGLEKEAMLHSQKKSIQNAIDVSIKHNRWKDAMMLDNQDDSIINTKVKDLAVHKARDFLSEGNIALAIQTYRIVEDYDKAASLLRQLAEKICKGSKQMLLAKKLFILAAYDIDSSQRQNREKWSGRQASVEVATLNSLVTSTSVHDTWRAAAACHYYLLSHRQFYKSKFTRSMLTALRCSEYIDILPACDVYALIALTAYRSKYFKVCSKAITKLGSLKILDEHMKRTIEYVAFRVFLNQPPEDKKDILPMCLDCLNNGASYHACTITGQSILNERSIECNRCHYFMLEKKAKDINVCPLCHTLTDMGAVTIVE